MKKILIGLLSLTLLASCGGAGTTYDYNVQFKLNGKLYKVKRVQIDGTDYIHVVYPVEDSLAVLPTQIVSHVSNGDDGTKPVTTVELK